MILYSACVYIAVVKGLHTLFMGMNVLVMWDFFKLLFIHGGMIVQHTPLLTSKVKFEFIFYFYLIHTGSNIYTQPTNIWLNVP